MIAKCLCQKCGQSIEFDVEQNLAFVDCPNCGQQTQLILAATTAPPNQQDAKKPGLAAGLREIWTDPKWLEQQKAKQLEQQKAKKEVPEAIGIFGIMFCFITGAILFFRGADEIASPEHDSVFPQIYGIIEVVGGFLMIGIGLLIQCLGKIHRKL